MKKLIIYIVLQLSWVQTWGQQPDPVYITDLVSAAQKAEQEIRGISDKNKKDLLTNNLNEHYIAFFLSNYFNKEEFNPAKSELDLINSVYGSFRSIMSDYENHFKRTGDGKVKDAIFHQCELLLKVYPLGNDRFSTEDVFLMQHLAQCLLYDAERLKKILETRRENQVALIFLDYMGDKEASLLVLKMNHQKYPKFKSLFDIYIKNNRLK